MRGALVVPYSTLVLALGKRAQWGSSSRRIQEPAGRLAPQSVPLKWVLLCPNPPPSSSVSSGFLSLYFTPHSVRSLPALPIQLPQCVEGTGLPPQTLPCLSWWPDQSAPEPQGPRLSGGMTPALQEASEV